MVVHYISGEQLYEWNTMTLVRDTWLTGLQHGAARARWLIHLAKIEREFLFGLFVPMAGMIGMTCARVLVIYSNHRPAFATVQKYYGLIKEDLKIVKAENPTLYSKVLEKIAIEVVGDLKDGVGAEDVAFWLGRILCGVAGIKKFNEVGIQQVTTAAVARIIAFVTVAVGVVHSPGIARRGVKSAIEHADIEKILKELQLTLPPLEVAQIALEMNAAKGSIAALERLKTNFTAVKPAFDEICEAFEKAE
ncbi:MAG TPA: hypothetical protein VJV78_47990 [Polyangiales bacterium]|nr:hypothetical protein [Polyangiales bacterium]